MAKVRKKRTTRSRGHSHRYRDRYSDDWDQEKLAAFGRGMMSAIQKDLAGDKMQVNRQEDERFALLWRGETKGLESNEDSPYFRMGEQFWPFLCKSMVYRQVNTAALIAGIGKCVQNAMELGGVEVSDLEGLDSEPGVNTMLDLIIGTEDEAVTEGGVEPGSSADLFQKSIETIDSVAGLAGGIGSITSLIDG